MGRILILVGLLIAVVGVVVQFAPWMINWFGKLPGDINIQTESIRVFIPITSMVIASITLTLVINGIRWIMNLFNR
jgi:hypothetical protein